MMNIQALKNSISKLLTRPLLWRVTGFVSSIVGFTCYAFSPSLRNFIGQWNPLKIIVYSVVSSVSCILMLFVNRCSGRWGASFLVKAHAGFVALILTSLWSLSEDRGKEGKVENGYGKIMDVISIGAFTLMAMSLSRQLQIGFEVGLFNFFLGCFLVTVMKMSLKLALVAALFCYLLLNIRSISDFLLEKLARGVTQHADGNNNTEFVNQHTDGNNNTEFVNQHTDLEANSHTIQSYPQPYPKYPNDHNWIFGPNEGL